MSSWVKFKTVIKNIEIFKKAVESLGFRLTESGTITGHEGTKQADYVLEGVPTEKGYNIGLNENADGTYTMEADVWDQKINQAADDIIFAYKEGAVKQVMEDNCLFEKARQETKEFVEIEIEV